jgi:hypothetical protein
VPDDNRESPRLELLGTLPGEVSVLAPISVRDISRKGVQVESAYPLLIGSAHDVRLHLGDQPVVVRARVVRCHIADIGHELVRYVAGLEFVDLAEHARAAIDAFIDDVRTLRAAADGPSDDRS